MSSEFVHLHLHTEYSLKDSMINAKDLAKKLKELGMDSVAITDHGHMYNILETYSRLKNAGIKPIIGMETYVAPRQNTDKVFGVDNANWHLVLLAENNTGYQNLMAIASNAAVEGGYFKPRTDKSVLRQHSEGIIALSACLGGEVQSYILQGDIDRAKISVSEYVQIFGEGNFFLELQSHGLEGQELVNQTLVSISKEMDVPLVATNDCHYLSPEDSSYHDVLIAFQQGKQVSDRDRMTYESDQFYLKSPEEMKELFSFCPEAISNTVVIADRCNVEIDFKSKKIPEFHIPESFKMTNEEFLRKITWDAVVEKYPETHDSKKIVERVNYEIDTLVKMGFVNYYLIVWDFFRFCATGSDEIGLPSPSDWTPIITGPGRGSAAGSIVSYALGITKVDPIKYSLLFERFLDPSRISMPDIDSDIEDQRRSEVIDYIVRKYGERSVCQVVTFSRLAARAAIRNIGRTMGITSSLVNEIASMVPFEVGMTIEKALKANPMFQRAYESDGIVKRLVDACQKLEGLPIHVSTHAAGVLVADTLGIAGYSPVFMNDLGRLTSQYDKNVLEEMNLLKVDLLGLKTLGIMGMARDFVKKNHGITINIDDLYLAKDPEVFKIIQEGKTEGIFQLESPGMTDFAVKLRVESIEDLTLVVAMYRPGPMDNIPLLLDNKKRSEKVSYPIDALRPILESTYGILCYQEQCMQSVVDIAGYDKSDSDGFRRCISKKIASLVPLHKRWFIEGRQSIDVDGDGNKKDYGHSIPGGLALGHDRGSLEKFFADMERFALYSFNKSHAVSYAVLGYATAFFAYYYPAEYFSALLNYARGNINKTVKYINYCRKSLGIDILPPDCQKSDELFLPIGPKQISYSLKAKGVPANAMPSIIANRQTPYRDIFDFLARNEKDVGKAAFVPWASIGALDWAGHSRSSLIAASEDLIGRKATLRKKFSGDELAEALKEKCANDIPDLKEYSDPVILRMEREYLGHYLTGHPLYRLGDTIADIKKHNPASFMELSVLDYEVDEETGDAIINPSLKDRDSIVFVGVINTIDIKTTRKNDLMAVIGVEDLASSAECVVWPNTWTELHSQVKEDECYKFTGYINLRDNVPGIVIEEVEPLESSTRNRIVIFVESPSELGRLYKRKILAGEKEPGEVFPTYIRYKDVMALMNKKDWCSVKDVAAINRDTNLKYELRKW